MPFYPSCVLKHILIILISNIYASWKITHLTPFYSNSDNSSIIISPISYWSILITLSAYYFYAFPCFRTQSYFQNCKCKIRPQIQKNVFGVLFYKFLYFIFKYIIISFSLHYQSIFPFI
jgi:hypothetical protein